MKKYSSVKELLGEKIVCDCGQIHETAFSRMVMEPGALKKVPEVVRELGFSRPFVLADTHTFEAAGKAVTEELQKAGFAVRYHVLKSPEVGDLPADEKALGSAAMAFGTESDLVISVGGGTINDTGRFLGFITGKPFIFVPTAPSMDGLVSNQAPLIFNNLKTTFQAQAPLALVCDLDVMSQAPMRMIAAGAGDIFGKYNCLIDWKLSNIINDEYYCDFIAGLVRTAVDQTLESTPGLKSRSREAVEGLTGALTLSGMAMDYAHVSRPASGAEHHLSHFWEMQYLFDGRPAVLHGAKVGVGTVLALDLYNRLAEIEKPDFEALRKGVSKRPSFEDWEKEIRRVYRDGAEAVVELERKSGKNDPEKLLKRLDAIEANWEKIRALAKTAPKASEIQKTLEMLDAPRLPKDVGLSAEYVHDGVLYAKELRNRYTVLQLLWDLDMLRDEAERITEKYGKNA